MFLTDCVVENINKDQTLYALNSSHHLYIPNFSTKKKRKQVQLCLVLSCIFPNKSC